jgi:hypothetical protein
MKRLLLLATLLGLCVSAEAQSVPPQFATLLTNSTDYTINPAVFIPQQKTTVASYSVGASNVVTITLTATVPYSVGQVVGMTGFSTTVGRLISGLPFTILSVTGTSFTASTPLFVHATATTTTDSATAALAWSGPSAGGSQLDATWGTTTYRAPLPTDCPSTSYNSSGNCATQVRGWTVDYSKTVSWSSDGHFYIMMDASGWVYLYDSSGGPPYTFLRRINTSTLATNPDCSAGGGLYGDNSDWNWANVPSTHTLYYVGCPSATGNHTQLKSIDASNWAAGGTIVRDFATEAAALGGDTVTEDREGNASDDDNIWSFGVRLNSTGLLKGVIRWNRSTNTVVSKTVGAGGLCGASACPGDIPKIANWVGTSPSGNYTIINQQCGGHNYTWVRGCGTEVFDSSLNYLGVASVSNNHGDVGYDVNGVEVYVTIPDDLAENDYYQVQMTKLAAVAPAMPTCTGSANGCWGGFMPPAGSRTVSFPCSYNWAGPSVGCPTGGVNVLRGKSYTISMRATQGSGKGYMLFSLFDNATDNLGLGGWGSAENLAVLMDWATAYQFPNDGTDGVTASFWRLGRTHAENAVGYYQVQADGVPDKTFSKFAWTSNYDINGVDFTSPTYAMFTLLPTGTVPTFVGMQGAFIRGKIN